MNIIEDIYWDILEIIYFYGIYAYQQFQILAHSWCEGVALVTYFGIVIFMLRRLHKSWKLSELSNSRLFLTALIYSATVGPSVFGLGGVATAPFPWLFGYSLYLLDWHNIVLNLKLLCFSVTGFSIILVLTRFASYIQKSSKRYAKK